ncbi:hypothetical protein MCUN1_000550 [Malassezia cuniculi]|uniref:LIM zinc-binding domain-containing protein n=1 Tax=Malassezia cuniculi TaxID=948313 RepID=A0AAF0J561_9BASI|nr:hypothetical protein MCUN1_000550 [Malassezia cuniculi]
MEQPAHSQERSDVQNFAGVGLMRFQGDGMQPVGIAAPPSSEWFPQNSEVPSIYSNLRLSSGPFPRFMKDASTPHHLLRSPTPVLLRYQTTADKAGIPSFGSPQPAAVMMSPSMDKYTQSPMTPSSDNVSMYRSPMSDGDRMSPMSYRSRTPGTPHGYTSTGSPKSAGAKLRSANSLRSIRGAPPAWTVSPPLPQLGAQNTSPMMQGGQLPFQMGETTVGDSLGHTRSDSAHTIAPKTPTEYDTSFSSVHGAAISADLSSSTVPELSPAEPQLSGPGAGVPVMSSASPLSKKSMRERTSDLFPDTDRSSGSALDSSSEGADATRTTLATDVTDDFAPPPVPVVQLEVTDTETNKTLEVDPEDYPEDYPTDRASVLTGDTRLSGIDAIDAFFHRGFALDESDVESVDDLRFSMSSRDFRQAAASAAAAAAADSETTATQDNRFIRLNDDLPPVPTSDDTEESGVCIFPIIEPSSSPLPTLPTIAREPTESGSTRDSVGLSPLCDTSNSIPIISLGDQHEFDILVPPTGDEGAQPEAAPSHSNNFARTFSNTEEPEGQMPTSGTAATAPVVDDRRKSVSEDRTCSRCNKLIEDVIVRSVDGLLGGVYHKECFSCTMCEARFPTGEFYVIDGKPFCAQHYHEWHGTICAVCGNGIEGVYYVTDDPANYHISCLQCEHEDCGQLLSEFFVYNQRRYCEAHAKEMQSAAAGHDFSPRDSFGLERRLTMLVNAPPSIEISAEE